MMTAIPTIIPVKIKRRRVVLSEPFPKLADMKYATIGANRQIRLFSEESYQEFVARIKAGPELARKRARSIFTYGSILDSVGDRHLEFGKESILLNFLNSGEQYSLLYDGQDIYIAASDFCKRFVEEE